MRIAVLLLSDLVGSVALQNRLGTQAYSRLLARHHELFREAVENRYGGRILNDTGDGFLAELPGVSDAVSAALCFQWLMAQERWQPEPLKVRVAVHLGEITGIRERGADKVRYVGMAINYAARLMELAQGGQILLSRAVYDDAHRNVRHHPNVSGMTRVPELEWRSHGLFLFKGADEPVEIFEVGARGLAALERPADSTKAVRIDNRPPRSGPTASRSLRDRLLHPSAGDRRRAVLAGVLPAVLGLMALLAGFLDSASYDLAYLIRPTVRPDEVVLVEMDSASHIQLNQPADTKWDRRLHARVLEQITSAGARAVGFDIVFTGPSGNPDEDVDFANALRQSGRAFLAAGVVASPLDGISIVPPHAPLREAARWGVVERTRGGRSIRRPAGGEGQTGAMTEAMAAAFLGRKAQPPPGAWLNYYGPPGTLHRCSFASVLSNEVPRSVFSNKVVLIGANAAIGYTARPGADYFVSPYTPWTGREIPGVEVNATSVANHIRDDWLLRLPPWLEVLLVAGFGAVSGGLLAHLKPRHTLLAGLGLLAGCLLLPVQVWWTHRWFPWLIPCLVQIPASLLISLFLRHATDPD